MRLALFNFRQTVDYRLEILSGLTVAMALIPEAVAFAFIAGLSPLTGLYAAFVVGLVASVLGGRPGMISGATGAIAVVLAELALSHGPEYIFATVILAGLLQGCSGLLRLGKLMRLVLQPSFSASSTASPSSSAEARSRSSRPTRVTGWPAPTWPSSGCWSSSPWPSSPSCRA